jgi:hypothetical protein
MGRICGIRLHVRTLLILVGATMVMTLVLLNWLQRENQLENKSDQGRAMQLPKTQMKACPPKV